MANPFIIKRPHITERATDLSALGQYVFIVQTGASKPEIKKAIKEIYKVDVVSVNVVNRPPKRKRFAGRMHGAQEGYRKAIITVKEGQKIDLH